MEPNYLKTTVINSQAERDIITELIEAQQAQGNMEELPRTPYKDSDGMFKFKLNNYDRIEGYNEEDPEDGLYQRDAVTAHLVDEAGNETGETVLTYMYHRSGISENQPIPNGDWMCREKSKEGVYKF